MCGGSGGGLVVLIVVKVKRDKKHACAAIQESEWIDEKWGLKNKRIEEIKKIGEKNN